MTGPLAAYTRQHLDAAGFEDVRADSGPRAVADAGAGHLPRLGEQVRDVERLLAQADRVLARPVDPASLPPADDPNGQLHASYLRHAQQAVNRARQHLAWASLLQLPAAGSAVPVPAHATYGLPAGDSRGEGPAPGLATTTGLAVGGSPGPFCGASGAGAQLP